MKILYDEEKAKKRAKKYLIINVTAISAFAVSLALFIVSCVIDSLVLGIVGGVPIAIFYGISLFTPSIPIRSAKDSDIAYLKLSKKCKILEVKVEKRCLEEKKEKISFLTVDFIGENEKGIVENIFTGILEEKMSTKVEEDTVDLERGVLYKPYSNPETSYST